MEPNLPGQLYEYEPDENWLAYAYSKTLPVLCDLSAFMRNDSYRILNSDSASSSFMFFTDFSVGDLVENYKEWRRVRDELYDPGELFAKLSIQIGKNNSLQVETLIYAYLGSLVTYRRTPNIMRFVFAAKCPRFFQHYDLHGVFTHRSEDGKQLQFTPAALLSKMFESPYELAKIIGPEADSIKEEYLKDRERTFDERMNILDMKYYRLLANTNTVKEATMNATFVERGHGSAFYQFKFAGMSKETFTELLFQIAYTIHEINFNGVRHNDLHAGNVWVNVNPPEVQSERLVYFIDSERFVVIGNEYQAKIYDFDRSAITGADVNIKNSVIEWTCPQLGGCSSIDPKYDMYSFFSQIYSYTLEGKLVTARRLKNRRIQTRWISEELEDVIVSLFRNLALSRKYQDPMSGASSREFKRADVPFAFGSRYCEKSKVKSGCMDNFEPSDDDIAPYEQFISSEVFRPMIRNRRKDAVPRVGRRNLYVSAKSGLTADEMYDSIFGQ